MWPWRRRHERIHSADEDEKPEKNPVLLIPGIGGSILNAVDKNGKAERVWVRLFMADHEFRQRLWSRYNEETGLSESMDDQTHIEVPEDNHGLYSCDLLDPDFGAMPIETVCYFHFLIAQMRVWGFKDGQTLFGFGYDFRQSNRLPATMERLRAKLASIVARTGKKVDVITHSMGGLVLRSLLALDQTFFQQHVRKWVAIGCPWRGAPAFIIDALLTGVEFVQGWEKSLFITKWSMHQLVMSCPSVYELMADYDYQWEPEAPELRLVRERVQAQEGRVTRDGFTVIEEDELGERFCGGGEKIPSTEFKESVAVPGSEGAPGLGTPGTLKAGGMSGAAVGKLQQEEQVAIEVSSKGGESEGRAAGEQGAEGAKGAGGESDVVEQRLRERGEILQAMEAALRNNTVEVRGQSVPLPLHPAIVALAQETRRLWDTAVLPPGVDFYSIYGNALPTPYHCQYGTRDAPLRSLEDMTRVEALFDFADGDGTVPVQSALGDNLDAVYRVGVAGEHRAMLNLSSVHRLVHFFLEVDGRDPLYDPILDFVIVPKEEEQEEEQVLGEGGRHKSLSLY